MIGLEGAAEHLRAGLAARLPAKLTDLEERYELAAGALPHPKRYTAHELPAVGLEDWPTIMVVGTETLPGWRHVDTTDAGAAVYAIRYRLRVFTFVRGDTFETTDLVRKRTVLAVREVLVERLAIDADLGFVDVTTIRESYSDVAPDPEAGATVAAAYTELELVLAEAADAPPPLGVIAAFDLDTATLPPHPAL